MLTLQSGCKVTYKNENLRCYEGLVTEMSSGYTCKVSWFKPIKARGTEWKDSLLVLGRRFDLSTV